MATPLTSARMLAALKSEGADVHEYKNWTAHNRNHVGAWGPVNGVIIHHTVSSGTEHSVALCYNGHTKLPGPLCHTVGAKDGRLFLVSSGRANHAGKGDPDVLQAVIDERALPVDNQATVDGNARFYGIELVNLGDGKDPWPDVQVEAAVRWAAAICRAHGWSARSVIGHKEWQPGKVDPTFGMNDFRARVAERLSHPASWNPEEDSVNLDDKIDLTWTDGEGKKHLLWAGQLINGRSEITVGYALANAAASLFYGPKLAAKLDAQTQTIDQLVRTVAQLSAGLGDLDPKEIVADLKQAIESIEVHLDIPED